MLALDGLIPIGEAARRMGVSDTWIRHLCTDGKLIHVRTGLGRLIDSEDLDRVIREREARQAEQAVPDAR